MKSRLVRGLRRYLVAGLLVWLPLGATVLTFKFLLDLMDQLLTLLPVLWRPDALLGFHIPGFGAILAFVVLLGTGFLVANLIGSTRETVSLTLSTSRRIVSGSASSWRRRSSLSVLPQRPRLINNLVSSSRRPDASRSKRCCNRRSAARTSKSEQMCSDRLDPASPRITKPSPGLNGSWNGW